MLAEILVQIFRNGYAITHWVANSPRTCLMTSSIVLSVLVQCEIGRLQYCHSAPKGLSWIPCVGCGPWGGLIASSRGRMCGPVGGLSGKSGGTAKPNVISCPSNLP